MSADHEWKELQELIERHLRDELSEAEMEQLAEQLDSDPAARQRFVEEALWDTRMAEVLRENRAASVVDEATSPVAGTLAIPDEVTSFPRKGLVASSTTDGTGLVASSTTGSQFSNVWKWASGVATLSAVVLLVLLVLNLTPRKTAMAYPSLGDFAVSVPRSEQNIWKAAGDGDLPALRRELLNNTPVDARSDCGLTPLHVATLFQRKAAIELLLAERANVSLADAEGNTALHMAAFLGQTDVVRLLLAGGSDVTLRNNLGFNASDLVAITWSSGLERYYRGVEKTLNTPLDLERIRTERPRILKLLSAAGPETSDAAPTVNLWLAAMTGNTAAVRQHIEAGTDLNAREDLGGSTPLMLAAMFGQPEAARLLIDAGANLELQNNSGGTALHVACFFCRPQMVELLLDAGADTHKTNVHGLTPLGVATAGFNAELEGAYRHVYDSVGLKFDRETVLQTRIQIAQILQDRQSESEQTESR